MDNDNIDMEMQDSDDSCTSPSIIKAAQCSSYELLSSKTRDRYEACFLKLMDWRNSNDITAPFSENILMAYFEEISEKFKSNTLWSIYSMLRTTISIKCNVDISKCSKLKALLKRKSDGKRPRKFKTLTSEEINKFLKDAPDAQYLFTKVALVIGINGSCSKYELCQLKISDIEDLGTAAVVNFNDTKTKKVCTFTLTGKFYKLFKKYADLRPLDLDNERFFLNYQNQKCTRQVVGENKFGNIPKKIATYLKLANPGLYTGHCFRRSSLADLQNNTC